MWTRWTAKIPTAARAAVGNRGGVPRCPREPILPSLVYPAARESSRNIVYSHRWQLGSSQVYHQCHRYVHSDRRLSMYGHRLKNHRPLHWPIGVLGRGLERVSSNKNSLEREFGTTQQQKNPRKGKKMPVIAKSKRTPAAHKMAAGMGITLEECSNYLIKECAEVRRIQLNKRQRLKPWIMALLVHRYDRGLREIDELNKDSVYYNGGSSSTQVIDLRKVLTPEAIEIDRYISVIKNQKTKSPQDRKEICDILRNEKLSLLATEARRILIDREIPFQDLADIKNETGVRKLSKQDPSVFLSLFSRAFCVSEKRVKQKQRTTRVVNDEGGVQIPDFSHRRFHPPSLKTAAHKKKKLKEKRDRERAETSSKAEAKNFHRNSPRELQQKLRAMSQRNLSEEPI